MNYQEKYRYVKDVQQEGARFNLLLQDVFQFYIKIMKGQVHRDTEEVLIQYSRDWEYPWVLIKSAIQPNQRVLDCGAGFSPLPFIWSQQGGEAHAIDKDVMICSKLRYTFHCFKSMVLDIISLPRIGFKKPSYLKPSNIFIRNWQRFKKIWRPYLWGPVWPSLLKKYRVNYKKGTLTNLPYEDGLFDVVSCLNVLEHMSLQEQQQGIREMSRVVKKDGKLIITYDKEKDLTDLFIKESGMRPVEIINFTRNNNPNNRPDVVGISLIKEE